MPSPLRRCFGGVGPLTASSSFFRAQQTLPSGSTQHLFRPLSRTAIATRQ
eukprot:CAMPEP_0204017668 /NCGR_PEP_ID=MMETSP0360-20130528/27553_1 /ASSEMBLY_ACC=CAM_ASM_000342 /TAXON_ID=268821 /ORGANISM="Scrippsiella Hangoei, Strain SHTV-5" /LENGTH=49 /DNA_ID= /DNA_START= /DNA_END= /DNA_ORIENTATION=